MCIMNQFGQSDEDRQDLLDVHYETGNICNRLDVTDVPYESVWSY